MANKIRVFISSTMEDLQNERRAVVKQVMQMNAEPVNAENLAPTGGSSWELIRNEIDSCHVFVLILGSSYGWIPPTGYGAGQDKSVTHLEWAYARQLGIPVYAYIKRLPYGTTPDAQRDRFRKEVSDWKDGVFRAEFDWADDLADKVWQTLTDVWGMSALKELVSQRAKKLKADGAGAELQAPVYVERQAGSSGERWVLLAGAGLSISAGYPTANALISVMVKQLWPEVNSGPLPGRFSFSQVAALYEKELGRSALLGVIRDLLSTPQEIVPTIGHMEAVQKFKTIVTTNFDELFERACIMLGIPSQVITPATQTADVHPGIVTIYKLSGTISDPESLLLTLSDLQRAINNKHLFAAACARITSRRVAVVGHSLYDEHVQQLLSQARPAGEGLYVNPSFSQLDKVLLAQFGLTGRRETADAFLAEFDPDQP